jgi:hypothetical protein
MSGLSIEFKIGDHIKKVIDKKVINNKIFQIINIKEIKGGNWHDGYSISFIATIELKTDEENIKPETETEEYCIQYINCMCQINNLYAIKVD